MSCAPVLKEQLMKEGSRDVSLNVLRENPDMYKGKLYILGGIIASSKVTDEGTVIEALYVPVDSRGYLREGGRNEGRYLAIFPKSAGILDPMIYKRGRAITIAGNFMGDRTGKLDEAEYIYPVFDIVQIYLWRDVEYYPYYYPYYPYYYYPYPYWWGGPWPYGPPGSWYN
jgi:outer membrane lipoprotein